MRLIIYIFLCAGTLFGSTAYYTNVNSKIWVTPEYSAQGEASIAFNTVAQPTANPATLFTPRDKSIYAGYSNFYSNSFNSGLTSVLLPVDTVQSVSVSLAYLFVPGIDSVTAILDDDGVPVEYEITKESASEIYMTLGYSRKFALADYVSVFGGANLHMNRRRLISWTGHGISADMGVLAVLWEDLYISGHINDVTTHLMYWNAEYSEQGLPKGYGGVGYRFNFSPETELVVSYKTPDLFGNSGAGYVDWTSGDLFEADVEHRSVLNDMGLLFRGAHYGAEFSYRNLAFRAGFNDRKRAAFGAGVHLFETVSLDFAYENSSDLERSYKLGTTFYWN
jgi:hypothetical protein